MLPIIVQVGSNFIIVQGDVDCIFDIKLVIVHTSMMLPVAHKLLIPLTVLITRECVEGLLPTRRAQQIPSIITIHATANTP